MRSHSSCLFDIGQSLLVDFGLCAPTRLVFLTLVSHCWWTLACALPLVLSFDIGQSPASSPPSIRPYSHFHPHLYVHLRLFLHSLPSSNIFTCCVCPHNHLPPLFLSFITVRLCVQPSSAFNSPRPLASSFIAGYCTSTHLHPPPPTSTHLHPPPPTSTHLHPPPHASTHIRPSPLAYIFTTVRIHLLQPPSAVYSPPSTSIVNHYWPVHRHQHPSIVPSVITVHVSLHSPRPYIHPASTLIAVRLPLQEGHSPEKCPNIFKLK